MKTIRLFIRVFCWMLSTGVILSDLGLTPVHGPGWIKYLVPLATAAGIIWLIHRKPQKNIPEKNN